MAQAIRYKKIRRQNLRRKGKFCPDSEFVRKAVEDFEASGGEIRREKPYREEPAFVLRLQEALYGD